MTPAPDCAKDAVVISPHKFPGGPGASGVTVLRDTVIRNRRPHRPGGGTVSFVSPWSHRYTGSVAAREEGGTPNVVGDIRAALVFLVKEAIGPDLVLSHAQTLRDRALAAWREVDGLHLFGTPPEARALPVFSFTVTGRSGAPIHHQLFVRMLSDLHGIQARGGCACAGPYAHRLLGITEDQSERIDARLRAGEELEKPGWVRLNLSLLHDDADVERILRSVPDLVENAEAVAPCFSADPATARFWVRQAS